MQLVDIGDEDDLYRRLVSYYVRPNGRVSSAAYKDRRKTPDNRISVDVARLTTPHDCLARGLPAMRLGILVARVPRELGFSVCHDPQQDNWAHALIAGANDDEKCDRLASETRVWVPDRDD